ncbi:MAG: hypothetical protein LBD64_00660 [Odoribacteraceae bacterium]|nr:hypothetical protein [Odoribacteraceae bacterium]
MGTPVTTLGDVVTKRGDVVTERGDVVTEGGDVVTTRGSRGNTPGHRVIIAVERVPPVRADVGPPRYPASAHQVAAIPVKNIPATPPAAINFVPSPGRIEEGANKNKEY